MDGTLLEAFRHHAWATRELLISCRGLSDAQLTSTTTGTYGSILDTLDHLILSDGGYLRRPTGSAPQWALDDVETRDLDEMDRRAAEAAERWERFLSRDEAIDSERLLILDQGAYEARLSVVLCQALHHGTLHREQVCAIITALGVEPPDLQVWAYAEATGRARERAPSD